MSEPKPKAIWISVLGYANEPLFDGQAIVGVHSEGNGSKCDEQDLEWRNKEHD